MSRDLRECMKIAQECGIQTRIIPCHIPIAFALLDSTTISLESSADERFIREYETINDASVDIVAQATHYAHKEKSATTIVMLELLLEIHQKLARLEQELLQNKRDSIALDSTALCDGLGHGVLCVVGAEFVRDRIYYVRFVLPNRSHKEISLFASAMDGGVLRILRIHSHNTNALDSFIVAREMEQLRQKRTAYD